jgi:dihydrofolate synthase/folylpolyglutamate synthase
VFEKAGIMRSNTPCVCGDANPPNAIAQYAEKIGALSLFQYLYLVVQKKWRA